MHYAAPSYKPVPPVPGPLISSLRRVSVQQRYSVVQRVLTSVGHSNFPLAPLSQWKRRMASPAEANTDGKPESDPTLPDASSNPVVAKVLKKFVEQYETRDTTFQDSIIDEVRSDANRDCT